MKVRKRNLVRETAVDVSMGREVEIPILDAIDGPIDMETELDQLRASVERETNEEQFEDELQALRNLVDNFPDE